MLSAVALGAVSVSSVVYPSNPDVALYGYDVVAYFSLEEGARGVQGFEKYSATVESTDASVSSNPMPATDFTFYFSNEHNRDTFLEDPWKYTPEWGGYCAWGIASEQEWSHDAMGPPADPKDGWVVHNGKLYVNSNSDYRSMFLKDLEGNVVNGDTNWLVMWGGLDAGPFHPTCLSEDGPCGNSPDKKPADGPKQPRRIASSLTAAPDNLGHGDGFVSPPPDTNKEGSDTVFTAPVDPNRPVDQFHNDDIINNPEGPDDEDNAGGPVADPNGASAPVDPNDELGDEGAFTPPSDESFGGLLTPPVGIGGNGGGNGAITQPPPPVHEEPLPPDNPIIDPIQHQVVTPPNVPIVSHPGLIFSS